MNLAWHLGWIIGFEVGIGTAGLNGGAERREG